MSLCFKITKLPASPPCTLMYKTKTVISPSNGRDLQCSQSRHLALLYHIAVRTTETTAAPKKQQA